MHGQYTDTDRQTDREADRQTDRQTLHSEAHTIYLLTITIESTLSFGQH